ncbi:MAG: AIR synthase family protein, partial [Nitrospinota bacterium]
MSIAPGLRLASGKLPHELLSRLLSGLPSEDPRVVVGPRVGEDAAVIDMGESYLVAKTDPITFATGRLGWYGVHINANDVACMGAEPKWFLATVLLPEGGTTEALAEEIFNDIREACKTLGVTLCGGHMEVTLGLPRPILVGQMLGEVEKEGLIRGDGARPGDNLILTKGIPIEGTALMAGEREEVLRKSFGDEVVDRAREMLVEPGISVVPDALTAARSAEVHAMHDPTEGGLATGVHELALASGVGALIQRERVPVLPEGEAFCSHFGLDPLGVIASG